MRKTEELIDDDLREMARAQSLSPEFAGQLIVIWAARSGPNMCWQILPAGEPPSADDAQPEAVVGYLEGNLALVHATEEERDHAAEAGYAVGSCDWGGCDAPTYAYRLSAVDETGDWLSVCREHAVGAEGPG